MRRILLAVDEKPGKASAAELLEREGYHVEHLELRGGDGAPGVDHSLLSALNERIEELRLLVQKQTDLLVRVDTSGVFEFVSDSYCDLFGKSRSELIGRSFVPLIHEEDRESTMRTMEALYQPPYTCRIEQRAWTKQGWRWLEWTDSAVLDEKGRVTAIVGSGRDITDRKEAEKQLREGEELFRTILDKLPIPLVVSTGTQERVILCNQRFLADFGYGIEQMPDVAHWWELAYPDPEYREDVRRRWQAAMAAAAPPGGNLPTMDVEVTCKDGTIRDVSVRALRFGEFKVIAFLDFTEVNAVEQELKRSLNEKDAIMKELNHRVKNNLALVSSLISLKERDGAAYLDDLRSQIDAIGFIHEKLYETDNATMIPIRSYLERMLPSVFSLGNHSDVEIRLDVPEMNIPTKTAVSIGLIVNELATNAIKHGFAPPEPPRFTVALSCPAVEDTCVMSVGNSGRPFPESVEIGHTDTLGLRLVADLVSQLDGSIELHRTPSPTFRIHFPVELTANRKL